MHESAGKDHGLHGPVEAAVLRPDEAAEFFTEERCHILEISGRLDDPALSIARARVEPGVTTQLHALDIAERYVIVSGEGRMELGAEGGGPDGTLEPTPVGPGDAVLIPPHVPQRITNTGTEDLVFYCFCTPAWREGVYRALE